MRTAKFEDLLALVSRLRGPEGCAWDRAQTPESLLPYLLEECYEVRDALLQGGGRELAAELGDLALHVAFQIVIAEERGAFSAGRVFEVTLEKMTRRHPQVFGPPASGPAADAGPEPPPLAWEELKRRERSSPRRGAGLLDGIPRTLPSLLKAQRLQERAAGVGFDWHAVEGALEKAREELHEVEHQLGPDAERPSRLEEELGDLLFAIVNVARKSGISAEHALERASAKFERRFRAVEALAEKRGLDLASAGLEQLDALWEEVKATGM